MLSIGAEDLISFLLSLSPFRCLHECTIFKDTTTDLIICFMLLATLIINTRRNCVFFVALKQHITRGVDVVQLSYMQWKDQIK